MNYYCDSCIFVYIEQIYNEVNQLLGIAFAVNTAFELKIDKSDQ